MDKILAGVAAFQRDVFPAEQELFAGLAHEQHPRALFITCSDSRVVPHLITQTKPGELFLLQAVGAIVPAHGYTGGVSATIEYAVAVLQVGHVIVCTHSDCGALRVLMDRERVAHLPAVASWLEHAEAARRILEELHADATGDERERHLARHHVAAQLANLRTHPAVATAVAARRLTLWGWHYDIERGVVSVLDEATTEFVPVPAAAAG